MNTLMDARMKGTAPLRITTAALALIIAICSAGLAMLVAAPAQAAVYTAKVITTGSGIGNVNIRQSTTTASTVYRTVAAGNTVGLNCYTQGQSLSGRYGTSSLWYAIDGGGWISDAYVYTGTSNPVAPACKTAKAMTVNGTGDVNIRPEPNTNRAPLRVVAAGSVVPLGCYAQGQSLTGKYGASSLWYQVVGGGWISDAYVYTGTSNPVTAPCVAPAPPSTTARPFGQTVASISGIDSSQCTWYALERAKAYSGVYPRTQGNAWQWASYTASVGWKVVPDAQANAIVVFQRGVHGASSVTGHVGWVTSVEKRADGTYIHMDDKNWIPGQVRTNVVIKDIPGMSYILIPSK